MSIPVSDLADKIADVPLLDFINALCSPIGNDVAAKQARYSLVGADLSDMVLNEGLDQIINPIDDEPASTNALPKTR